MRWGDDDNYRKRHELILEELSHKDFLTLQELIDRTGCSASTIRRDLSKLQQLGKLQRVHGWCNVKKKIVWLRRI